MTTLYVNKTMPKLTIDHKNNNFFFMYQRVFALTIEIKVLVQQDVIFIYKCQYTSMIGMYRNQSVREEFTFDFTRRAQFCFNIYSFIPRVFIGEYLRIFSCG